MAVRHAVEALRALEVPVLTSERGCTSAESTVVAHVPRRRRRPPRVGRTSTEGMNFVQKLEPAGVAGELGHGAAQRLDEPPIRHGHMERRRRSHAPPRSSCLPRARWPNTAQSGRNVRRRGTAPLHLPAYQRAKVCPTLQARAVEEHLPAQGAGGIRRCARAPCA